MKLILPALLLIFALIPTSFAYAQLPIQSGTSIVKIGDASWYYWNNTASDTCMLWLGGGTTNEQAIGYYSYEINPFQYESFGTIRFIQNLAKHFCVVALEEGSYASFSPNSNRTIHEEPYEMGSRIIIQVRDWIRDQGYAHVFLVGYSSGAQVAAMEVAVSAPEEWISPDGVILITPRLSEFVTQNAYRIHASLLVLYGGSIETPAYVSTGHEFYADAPRDGWYTSYYLQKEFEVIEGTGHEVWTVFETGTYDTHAVCIIVNFIDEVRSLQFTSQEVSTISNYGQNLSETANSSSVLTLVSAPSELSPSNLLRIQVGFAYSFPAATEIDIVVLDPAISRVASAATFLLSGSGSRIINLDLAPSSNSSQLPLSILALKRVTSGLQLIAKPLIANIRILQTINVTVLSTAPNVIIVFDGTEYRTATNGILQLETRPGEHIVQASPIANLNSNARIIFAGWEDGSTTSIRRLNLDNNTTLSANYRIQYFVNVSSVYGQTTGSGWYEADTLAVISIDRPLFNDSRMIFAHWTGDVSSDDTRTLLTITSSSTVIAEWMPIAVESNQSNSTMWLLFSLISLSVGLAWNFRISWRERASHPKS